MAARTTARKTATATAVDVDFVESNKTEASPEAVRAEQEAAAEGLQAAIDRWADAFKVQGTRRHMLAMVASFVVGLGIGLLAAPVINALAVATLLVSGSAFLATLVYIIGFIITGVAAYFAGGVVGNYVNSGKAEAHYEGAKRWVTGLFGRKTVGA